jgi:hypothetical protein
MIRKAHLFIILLAMPLTGALPAAEAPKQKAVALPVDFTENRFFVTPMTVKGEKLRLYTDSGGGLFLFSGTVKRLGLPAKTMEDGQEKLEIVALPAFRPEASIPPPVGNGGQLPAVDAGHRVSLGFKTDKDGQRLLNFPRIAATVDGETLDLLFDTGATVVLSPEALAKLGDKGPALRGTSFIAAVHFDAWRQKHPDWRVVENADLGVKGEPMIEVPAVTVAGYTVGPVWFTRRPDPNFHQGMSQYMDRQVEGALGGSALRFFRVTVDYPNAVAVFERP